MELYEIYGYAVTAAWAGGILVTIVKFFIDWYKNY